MFQNYIKNPKQKKLKTLQENSSFRSAKFWEKKGMANIRRTLSEIGLMFIERSWAVFIFSVDINSTLSHWYTLGFLAFFVLVIVPIMGELYKCTKEEESMLGGISILPCGVKDSIEWEIR